MIRCSRHAGTLLLIILALASGPAGAAEPELATLLGHSRRIVFLGDSITAAGPYVSFFDAWLVARKGKNAPVVIDAGLPSETVSGLSEEGHAGGKFPRPDLAERLERVLKLTRPDLVIACYGINCGIYEPVDEERFARYQRGIGNLKTAVEQAGAKLILVTPPFYDDMRAPRPFSYNAVLDRYSRWLLDQRGKGWPVIDLHGPMTREVQARRKTDPTFTLQPDGVHPNDAGHWFVARTVIGAFGDEQAAGAATPEEMLAEQGVAPALLPLVRKRVELLRDAYVSAAGHKRPGMPKGLSVSEAVEQADAITAEIGRLLVRGQ